MTDTQAHQVLLDIQATLATLTKMALDIDPSICTDGDLAELRLINANLGAVEDDLGRVCADNNEAQENEDGGTEFPFEAWDLCGDCAVVVTGWNKNYPGTYDIVPGIRAAPGELTTVFPQWYLDAQAAEADAADERETLDDVRNGGACQ